METPTPPTNQNKKSQKLPQLRKGISISFNDYDSDGKPQWLINDPARNKFFIIGWLEYELLERWTIGDTDKLVEAVQRDTTLHVDRDDVENLLRFLSHNYLIQQSGYHIYNHAKEQKLFKKDNLLHWLISYYLFFRIPLVHPDNFLIRTKRIGEFIFSRYVLYIMAFLAIIGIYQLSTQWEQFTHTFPTIFTLTGLFYYFIAYSICKLCHELGHAYMCRRYGVPVPTLGIAFLVFWPVLYTDTTLSWSLDNKKRLRIALAGIWIETYVTIIALLLWCNVHNLTIQAICYVTIAVNWIASLLINVSPFMRFDGYYVLADYLKMPNLQPRAFALTRWQIRHWLFHWPDPPPENYSPRMHQFLVAYSLFTWIYRLGLYFGIAILVYHFFIKIVGILLFAIELFVFILGPIVSEVQSWIIFKDKFSLNKRTKITIFITFLLIVCLFMPLNETVKMPGTISYQHQFLISPTEGVLNTVIPPIGTHLKANQTIIEINSAELDRSLSQTILEYQKLLTELRRSTINSKYSDKRSILLSDISKQQTKYKKLYNLRNNLNLKTRFNGILIDTAPNLYPGAIIMKDEWLGDVINPNVVIAEGYVSQIDINSIQPGMKGYFYPHDLSEPAIPLKISTIEVINATKLNCVYSSAIKQDKKQDLVTETPCYNSNILGGDIATYYSDEGEYVPVNSVFRVTFIPLKETKLKHIERGTIVINTKPNSYAHRIFYSIKTLFIKQSEF